MKTILIVLVLCIGLYSNALGSEKLPISKYTSIFLIDDGDEKISNKLKSDDVAITVSIFTAYGYARVWFYPSGNIKKIKCRAPHDNDCFWIDSSEPNVIHVNLVETAGGWQAYAASNYVISLDPDGDTIFEQ